MIAMLVGALIGAVMVRSGLYAIELLTVVVLLAVVDAVVLARARDDGAWAQPR